MADQLGLLTYLSKIPALKTVKGFIFSISMCCDAKLTLFEDSTRTVRKQGESLLSTIGGDGGSQIGSMSSILFLIVARSCFLVLRPLIPMPW